MHYVPQAFMVHSIIHFSEEKAQNVRQTTLFSLALEQFMNERTREFNCSMKEPSAPPVPAVVRYSIEADAYIPPPPGAHITEVIAVEGVRCSYTNRDIHREYIKYWLPVSHCQHAGCCCLFGG